MIFSIWLNSPHPVNCLEVSSSHQRSGTQASASIHAEQVLHANTLQMCIRGSHSVLFSFFQSVLHTSPSKVQAAAPCLFYTSLSPSISSPPSPHHHLKEQSTDIFIHFPIFFLIHSTASFNIM